MFETTFHNNDSSMSSTFDTTAIDNSMNHQKQNKQHHSSPLRSVPSNGDNDDASKNKRRKIVRFNDQPTISLVDAISCDQDKAERWYTPSDLQELRKTNSSNNSDGDDDSVAPGVCPDCGCSISNSSTSGTKTATPTKRRMRFTKPKATTTLLVRNDNTASCSCPASSSSSQQQQHQRRARQRALVVSVLEQQNEHKRLGIDDPKGLFQLSRRCSKISREQAQRKAAMDAKEARRILRDTSRVIDDVLSLMEDMDL
mmetsp:Transcript_26697/g.74780  ORF Transcript_26697/g.74780 Transcript_26697/m.74780 type:complete len:256 (+) Transcript_26697:181-948(+)|eukprot:CAMPEP_0119553932 /NCGR_PEP_ID=MMETSP1352-20130426/6542_1 /TAXON_ID=265584 /ORGANISM="Stauroneis constricta, Strain CCMP1120" /LENGTH=255 /DNA_ID=CAMNT_0007600419 /DNA_START=79 /DNA_END=846 /DNA_ORIENTATION=+